MSTQGDGSDQDGDEIHSDYVNAAEEFDEADNEDNEDNEDDLEESFEIIDYTVASPWEKFISRIEEKVREWTSDRDPASPRRSETILYNHINYQLSHHSYEIPLGCDRDLPTYMRHMLSATQDLLPPGHSISQYFGLSEFLIISPLNESSIEYDETCMLLSSMRIALSNIQSEIPCFVPVGDFSKKTFVGYSCKDDFVTRFEVDGAYSAPSSLSHLSGLTDFFVAKMGGNVPRGELIYLSAKLNYSLIFSNNSRDSWRGAWMKAKEPTYNHSDTRPHLDPSDWLASVAWGPTMDPIESVRLSAIWSNFSEDELIDNGSFSHLKPKDAPNWLIDITHRTNIDPLSLSFSRTFRKILVVMKETEVLQSFTVLPPSGISPHPDMDWGSGNLKIIASSIQSAKLPSASDINAVLQDMFDHQTTDSDVSKPSSIKGAPPGSLLSLVAHYMSDMPGIIAMSLLWKEITHELRWHWENSMTIPRVAAGLPNTRYSLLFQKLQMLNCCIEERRRAAEKLKSLTSKHESIVGEEAAQAVAQPNTAVDKLDSDEEHDGWDVDDAIGDEIINSESSPKNQSPTTFDAASEAVKAESDAGDEVPRGVKAELSGMFLIVNGKQMNEPVTLECPPITEDMIQRQQEIFSLLGTTEEATNYRARLQSASLFSDMQAFKAANPGALLEDFVRWHSPRDWIVEQSSPPQGAEASPPVRNATCTNGKLSQRMTHAGNLWQSLWKEAKSIPAMEQEALYDYTKEAEFVLDYMETIQPSVLMEQLLLVLLADFVHISQCSNAVDIPVASEALQKLRSEVDTIVLTSTNPTLGSFIYIAELIEKTEIAISFVSSLLKKFPYATDIVPSLALAPHYLTRTEKERHAVSALLANYKDLKFGQYPEPDSREYVLRTVQPCPLVNVEDSQQCLAEPSAQRLYVSIRGGRFVIALALTNG